MPVVGNNSIPIESKEEIKEIKPNILEKEDMQVKEAKLCEETPKDTKLCNLVEVEHESGEDKVDIPCIDTVCEERFEGATEDDLQDLFDAFSLMDGVECSKEEFEEDLFVQDAPPIMENLDVDIKECPIWDDVNVDGYTPEELESLPD